MFAFPFEFSRTSDVENLARCYLQSLSGNEPLLAQWQGWIGDPDGTTPNCSTSVLLRIAIPPQFGWESTLPKRRFACVTDQFKTSQ